MTTDIENIHGRMLLGIDKNGEPYTVYDPDEDPNKYDCQKRLTLSFGRDKDGNMVVSNIEQDIAGAAEVIQAARGANMPASEISALKQKLISPKQAEIMDVRFEVGKEASGLPDPWKERTDETQQVLNNARENFAEASSHNIPVGELDAPAINNSPKAQTPSLTEGQNNKDSTPIQGRMVLGVDKDGNPYTVYDPDGDPNRSDCQKRVILTFGQDQDGNMVVNDIEQDVAGAFEALETARDSGMPKEMVDDLRETLCAPEKAEIMGVEFEKGGPAIGLSDPWQGREPEVERVLEEASKNYEAASFHKIPVGSMDGMDVPKNREHTAERDI